MKSYNFVQSSVETYDYSKEYLLQYPESKIEDIPAAVMYLPLSVMNQWARVAFKLGQLFYPIVQKNIEEITNNNNKLPLHIQQELLKVLEEDNSITNYNFEKMQAYHGYLAFYEPDGGNAKIRGGQETNSYGVAYVHKKDGPPHIHNESLAMLRGGYSEQAQENDILRYNASQENPVGMRGNNLLFVPSGKTHGHVLPSNLNNTSKIDTIVFGFAQGCDHTDACLGDFHIVQNLEEYQKDLYKLLGKI